MPTSNNSNDLHREIERTLGIVPGWARQTPPTALNGFWALMRDFSMPETTPPNKYKELIGLGVQPDQLEASGNPGAPKQVTLTFRDRSAPAALVRSSVWRWSKMKPTLL